MLSIASVFWIMVALFTLIGALRGSAREILVSAGAILGLFIITVVERFLPSLTAGLINNATTQFWFRLLILLGMVFIGYQTPNFRYLTDSGKLVRDKFENVVVGAVFGLANGFLIVGSIWYYLHEANYPFEFIIPPMAGTEMGDAALRLLPFLPPHWATMPLIFIAVAVMFVVVLMVFI